MGVMTKVNITQSKTKGTILRPTLHRQKVLDRCEKLIKLASKDIEAYRAIIVVLVHPTYGTHGAGTLTRVKTELLPDHVADSNASNTVHSFGHKKFSIMAPVF